MMRRNDRGLWIALGVLVLILLAGPMLGGGMMGPGMMGGWYGRFGGGNGWLWGLGMGLGGLMMLAFWGALIALAVLFFRRAGGRTEEPPSTGPEAPENVLKRRYAAGEITREQYEEMRHVLTG